MVRCGLLLLVTVGSLLHGQVPDARQWSAEYLSSARARGRFPIQLAVGKEIVLAASEGEEGEAQSGVELVVLDQEQLLGASYLTSPPQIGWEFEINRPLTRSMDTVPQKIGLGTGSEAVLWKPQGKPWQLWGGSLNELKRLRTRGNPKAEDVRSLLSWLFDNLGWDGVILAKKGSSYLVGASDRKLSSDSLQALVMKSSENAYTVAKGSKGSGIINLQSRHQGFGVFSVLIGDTSETYPIGTKVIIESAEQK